MGDSHIVTVAPGSAYLSCYRRPRNNNTVGVSIERVAFGLYLFSSVSRTRNTVLFAGVNEFIVRAFSLRTIKTDEWILDMENTIARRVH